MTAVKAGADNIDGACRGLGAGAGNAATEAIVASFNKMGWETGIDLYGVMDVAEDIIGGEIGMTPIVNRPSLVLGYAGVYSSFLRHAENASKRFGVPASKILEEVGKRKAVGGQEDLIIECAIELAQAQSANAGAGARDRLMTTVATKTADWALDRTARREPRPARDRAALRRRGPNSTKRRRTRSKSGSSRS